MSESELKRTALYDQHVSSGAKMVPFGGWSMPLHYGSQLQEHRQVRAEHGVFDVSHMTLIDVTGDARKAFLTRLLANNVKKLRVLGQAQYTLLLNESGGIIDDLIVYYLSDRYRLVFNSSTREKVLQWLEREKAPFSVSLQEREDLSMLAVQGPKARSAVANVLGDEAKSVIEELLPFTSVAQANWQIARTGYTGEDGLEILLPSADVADLWARLLGAGIQPIGLGARDTLRLEAGLNLYGQDMDETTTPFESGLGWTVALSDERDFIGSHALREQAEGGVFVGVLFTGKGVLRAGYEVVQNDQVIGALTSGSFAPTLEASIGLARVKNLQDIPTFVSLRGKCLPVQLVQPPFYRKGAPRYVSFFGAQALA